ncbi:hypothetical protein SEEN6907_21369 [Salmonella enterica subsp. enterica serovar Newport str. VA_R100506907]|nr:hypothetical protein SEEN6907_21369 [Salmonella enterica subsp. enterica serovar Newport str. VA_R100506907]
MALHLSGLKILLFPHSGTSIALLNMANLFWLLVQPGRTKIDHR